MNTLDDDESVSVLEQIAEHSARQQNGCLKWQKGVSPTGYGRLWTGKRLVRAHRGAWIAHNGPISSNMCVCHKCDNRWYVEIKHLFLGTNDENMADMVAKGRQPLGERNGLSKLSKEDVIAIYTTHRQTRALANKYGVSETTIRDIRRREIWADVTCRLPEPERYAGRDKPIRIAWQGSAT